MLLSMSRGTTHRGKRTSTLSPAQGIAIFWGKQLHAARKNAGYTQTTFADACNVKQTTVSRYERGISPWTPEAMLRFAAILNLSMEELFPWTPGIVTAEQYRLGVAA